MILSTKHITTLKEKASVHLAQAHKNLDLDTNHSAIKIHRHLPKHTHTHTLISK